MKTFKAVLKLAVALFLLSSAGYLVGTYYSLWQGLADGYQQVQDESVEL